jgi:hypothetical protein
MGLVSYGFQSFGPVAFCLLIACFPALSESQGKHSLFSPIHDKKNKVCHLRLFFSGFSNASVISVFNYSIIDFKC